MRRPWIWLGAIAIIALAWWLVAGSSAAPQRLAAGAPGASASGASDAPRALGGPVDLHQHPLAVTVIGCRRRPAAGAKVVALAGARAYVATADGDGRASVLVPDDVGTVLVRASVGRHTSAPVPAERGAVEVSACPGAGVHGKVVDQDGTPVPGVAIALSAEDGSYIDETVSDDDGAYELADAQLDGRGLVVETSDGPSPRALGPLAAAEDREVDVIVGGLREVVGWVLDMNGDPQPGVVVTLRAEKFESTWAAITGPGGEFRFPYAPSTPVRVDADGGELGLASARLAGSSAPRREVELVLEPMGTITVFGPDKGEGTVAVVRCFDARYHGADDLYTDDLDAAGSDPYGYDFAGDGAIDPRQEGPADTEPDPSMDSMFATMADGLRGFDRDKPLESVTRVMATMMRAGLGGPDIADPSLDIDAAAAETAKQLIESAPELVAAFARASELLGRGLGPREAFETAARELGFADGVGGGDEPPAEVEDTEDGPVIVTKTPRPEVDGVTPWDHSAEYATSMGSPVEESVEPYDAAGLPEAASGEGGEGEELTTFEPLVVDASAADDDQRAVATRGGLGVPMRVRASYAYAVQIRYPDGTDLFCGRVFVDPGADAVVRCGEDQGEAHIVGRIVGTDGQPLTGIVVSEGQGQATTDADGRFDLAMQLWSTSEAFVMATDPSGAFTPSSRRNINATASEVTDIGELVMRRPEETPIGSPTEDFGGIGGLVSLDETGLHLDDLEPDSPLALAGAEAGDAIIMVDGVSAGELSMDELLLRLRGEAGSHVNLRLRNGAGEVFELDLERAIIRVGPEKWSGTDEGAPTTSQDPGPPVY